MYWATESVGAARHRMWECQIMMFTSARTLIIIVCLTFGLTVGFAVTGMGFGLWIQQFTVQDSDESGALGLDFLILCSNKCAP